MKIMSKRRIKYKISHFVFLLCWVMGTSFQQKAFAQLINNGAKIVVQRGATISSASRVDNRANGTIINDGTILIKGSLNHLSGTFTNNREVNLLGNLLLNSTLTHNANSTFRFSGNLQQMNGTADISFWDLIIAGSNQINNPQKVILNQNIVVRNQLHLAGNGYINLNQKFIDLGSTGSLIGENNDNRIREEAQGGYIQATNRTVSNTAGLGLSFQTTEDLGTLTIRRGHDLFTNATGSSIKRYFDIISSKQATENTVLSFKYFNGELTTQRGAFSLGLYNSQDKGITWKENQSNLDEFGGVLSTPIVAEAGQENRWSAFDRNFARVQATLKSSVAGQVCEGEKLQLEATEIEGATYAWTGPNGFRATGRTPIVDFSTNLKSGDYTVTANVSGTILTDKVNVKISTGTAFDVVVKNALCQGNKDGSIRVTSKSGLPLSFKMAESATFHNTILFEFLNLGKGEYIIFAIDELGCQSSQKINVGEQTQLVVDAGKDIAVIKGSSVQLQASGATSYRWEPAIGLDNPNVANPTAKPEITTAYKVFGNNTQGCESTDEVIVTVSSVSIPDRVLSPNNDGVNDFWVIKDIELFPNSEVVVYDRWSQEVFSAKGYQNNWDGKGLNGQLPDGTYYFVVKFDETNIIKGTVTIVR
jgi:gliding motility-associated-like protein